MALHARNIAMMAGTTGGQYCAYRQGAGGQWRCECKPRARCAGGWLKRPTRRTRGATGQGLLVSARLPNGRAIAWVFERQGETVQGWLILGGPELKACHFTQVLADCAPKGRKPEPNASA